MSLYRRWVDLQPHTGPVGILPSSWCCALQDTATIIVRCVGQNKALALLCVIVTNTDHATRRIYAMPWHVLLFPGPTKRPIENDLHGAMQRFHSRAGKAYLFSAVVNVVSAAKEQRAMTTGLHIVSDLYCNGCMQLVGWTYVSLHVLR